MGTATPCVGCIAGGGVWCSRSYSYNYTGTLNYQAGNTAANTGFMETAGNQLTAGATTSGLLDNGACCSSDFTPWTTLTAGTELDYNTTGSGGTADAKQTDRFMITQTCPAIVDGSVANTYGDVNTAKWGKYKLGLTSTAAF